MPKMKTHRGAAKRFKKTKKGKVKFKRAKLRHNLSCKSHKQKKELAKGGYLADGDARRVRRLLAGQN